MLLSAVVDVPSVVDPARFYLKTASFIDVLCCDGLVWSNCFFGFELFVVF